MTTIIAGSRDIADYRTVEDAVTAAPWLVSRVVSGGARGVDTLGERWAKENNVPLVIFSADWDTYGRSAGYRRNVQMAENADALIAIWDGKSKGTKHMIDIARDRKLTIYVLRTDGIVGQ